jgi:hypothetical protein
MLEYVFFNAEPCARFLAYVREMGLEPTLTKGELESVVGVEEDRVDDAMADALDTFYDAMFALDQSLHDGASEESCDEYRAAGVVVNLKDGRAVYADIPPDILGKVMQALTLPELSDLVNAIVDAVEHPDPRSLCQRRRDAAAGLTPV